MKPKKKPKPILCEDTVSQKTWDEFRETGLLMFVNQFLHIFGWAIVASTDFDTGKVIRMFPARVTYRGFTDDQVSNSHIKLAKYVHANSKQLLKEANL